jgi:hypothetical protein
MTVMTSTLRDRYKIVWKTMDNANLTSISNAHDTKTMTTSNKYRSLTV